MSTTTSTPVKDLTIDLNNFRTVPQKNELEATKAMISTSPDYFLGLMESLIEDGYLPTENIIVLEGADKKKVVKEGNRRVASLKVIQGLINPESLNLPEKMLERIAALSPDWKAANATIPCAIYDASEADVVDRIVTRTHGKGQKAGRDPWEAVARARHNKIANGASEPALDLLEKYLNIGDNITQAQKIRWAGKYNLTVLDEAIKKLAPRLGVASSPELAKKYPGISHRKALDEIIHAIGMGSLTFPNIRDSADFALRFGIPPLDTGSSGDGASDGGASDGGASGGGASGGGASGGGTTGGGTTGGGTTGGGATGGGATGGGTTGGASTPPNGKPAAAATNDERSMKRSLRALKLFGPNRSKVETLRKEALKLKLKDNSIAFCFLLRSMFEISAKAYCQDHATESGAPKALKADGNDRILAEVLRDIVTHLTQNGADKQMQRLLHGPGTEIQKKDGILSLTSMNQLVHNPSFTILPSDIPTLFANIFPLLEQMNK
ncbi:hypothetical protein [Achromobacter xylosoxidans]|uniref:hypothetical protein n=1 Tax=Alcaligenes xylosoxydans xylosoxydans TaxID=85698 RepID=UPI00293001D0|nr:hypothetical protein [Achromobacter xylosoxidans]WOB76267.1 hypothetical protein PZA07_12580 [Achromobacter xylosoxidans]